MKSSPLFFLYYEKEVYKYQGIMTHAHNSSPWRKSLKKHNELEDISVKSGVKVNIFGKSINCNV